MLERFDLAMALALALQARVREERPRFRGHPATLLVRELTPVFVLEAGGGFGSQREIPASLPLGFIRAFLPNSCARLTFRGSPVSASGTGAQRSPGVRAGGLVRLGDKFHICYQAIGRAVAILRPGGARRSSGWKRCKLLGW